VPKRAWLNELRRIAYADYKLTQLMVAREVGFTIPNTLVTNTWESINKILPEKIILKPSFDGYLYESNHMRIACTKLLDNHPSKLPTATNPYPGLWQPYLSKAREWRITVVAGKFFDAAIYTTKNAKDDWRVHQLDKRKVRFKSETFPDIQKKKCLRYLKKMGLKFGAFDFVEDEDGKITFLECNSNGQYGWLEDRLGFDISGAIASELAAIADAA
jgi:glutathione synthase/RimK-type ligase-like ATP-grasp enzyme